MRSAEMLVTFLFLSFFFVCVWVPSCFYVDVFVLSQGSLLCCSSDIFSSGLVGIYKLHVVTDEALSYTSFGHYGAENSEEIPWSLTDVACSCNLVCSCRRLSLGFLINNFSSRLGRCRVWFGREFFYWAGATRSCQSGRSWKQSCCPVAHQWHRFEGTPGAASAGNWNGPKTHFEGYICT